MFTSKEDILREVYHQCNLGNTFSTITWTQSKITGDSESNSSQPTPTATLSQCHSLTVSQRHNVTYKIQATCDPSQPSLSIMLSGRGRWVVGATLITVGKVFTNFHFLSLISDLMSCHVGAQHTSPAN